MAEVDVILFFPTRDFGGISTSLDQVRVTLGQTGRTNSIAAELF